MTEFNREVRKAIGLLAAGIMLVVAFMLYGGIGLGEMFAGIEEILFTVAVIMYPIGIVYGWKELLHFNRNAKVRHRVGYVEHNVAITGILFGARIAIMLMFGWIYGVYNLYKKLAYLKSCEGETGSQVQRAYEEEV